MTDFTDRPNTEPTGVGDDAADARWFRAAVAPVVDAKPVPEAWDEIRARATGEAPTVVRLEPAGRRQVKGPRRRMALVAATVIAVAGIGGAIAVTQEGDDGPDETVVATPTDTDATGWYVPADLPEGWELESVETDWMDIEGLYEGCPCDQIVWSSADGLETVGVVNTDDDKFSIIAATGGDDVEPLLLPEGIEGHVASYGEYQSVSWVQDGRGWQAVSATLDRDAVIEAASRIIVDPTAPPVDGFEELFRSAETPGSARAFHSVAVRLVDVERRVSLTYSLQPFDIDRASTYLSGTVESLDPVDAERPILVSRILPRPERETGYNEIFVGGRWPAAWVMAGVGDSSLSEGPATEEDVITLLRSLRPATGDEWMAFLDTATGNVEEDARADNLSDLIVHEGDNRVTGLDDENDRAVDDDQEVGNDSSPGTQAADITTEGPDAPNTRLIAVAKSLVAGQEPFAVDDLFAPSVAIGLDFETVRTVGRRNLSDPQAWVIDEDDVEAYAGHTPPFSALQLLADTGAFATVGGPTEGCAQPTPNPPPTTDGHRLVTITPGDIDSCIDWFAVTLVLDEQDLIAGVHLYLREP